MTKAPVSAKSKSAERIAVFRSPFSNRKEKVRVMLSSCGLRGSFCHFFVFASDCGGKENPNQDERNIERGKFLYRKMKDGRSDKYGKSGKHISTAPEKCIDRLLGFVFCITT